ncbi:type II secretion system F family protein [Streptomyces sp. NPDC001054]
MNPAVLLPATAAGVLAGLAVRAAVPARPDLAATLRRMSASNFVLPIDGVSVRTGSATERLGRWLQDHGLSVALPVTDLRLLRKSPAEHLGKRVVMALYGLLAPLLLEAMLAAAGAALPLPLPAAVGLVLAVVLWLAPGHDVAREAAAARLVVRHAAASYLERVALARISNSGAAQALTDTADVGDGWIFARMRAVFAEAELAGVTPWDALKQLGEELDIPELTRPADTLALAGDGAAVYSTLQAQARQLRVALLSDAKAKANEASASMILPVTAAVILMLMFVMIPVSMTILAS